MRDCHTCIRREYCCSDCIGYAPDADAEEARAEYDESAQDDDVYQGKEVR